MEDYEALMNAIICTALLAALKTGWDIGQRMIKKQREEEAKKDNRPDS
jgi:hypothetical protein